MRGAGTSPRSHSGLVAQPGLRHLFHLPTEPLPLNTSLPQKPGPSTVQPGLLARCRGSTG